MDGLPLSHPVLQGLVLDDVTDKELNKAQVLPTFPSFWQDSICCCACL